MRWLVSLAVMALAGLVQVGPARAQAPELAQDAPDVVFGAAAPHVQAKAEELGDAVRIYEFVRNELGYENYFGLMKGPETTLLSGGGNDYDLAALLVSMLRAVGVPARFARGRMHLTGEQAMGWLGTTNSWAASRVLAAGQPEVWIDEPTPQTAGVRWGGELEIFDLFHVWVEARVPYAGYRGAFTSSPGGEAWIPLDPSFKERQWKSGAPLPIGGTALRFDYTSPEEGYYNNLHHELPTEVFKQQAQRYLALERPGESLEDASYVGSIIREVAGVLPNSLPYSVLPFPPATRHARLVNLHCHSGTASAECDSQTEKLSPFPLAGSNGGRDYRYDWRVSVAGISLQSTSAALSGKRITVLFRPESTEAIPTDGSSPCESIRTLPEIRVDGVAVATTAPDAILSHRPTLCTPLDLLISSVRPAPGTPFADLGDRRANRRVFPIKAGSIVVPLLMAGTPGRVRVERASQDLVTMQAEVYPILESEAGAFVDNDASGTQGVRDPSEPYFAHSIEAQESLVGGLLHLASLWYQEKAREGIVEMIGLHQIIESPAPWVGIISSNPGVDYVIDTAFPSRGGHLLADIPGAAFYISTRDGVAIDWNESNFPATPATHYWELVGHHASALEHAVWEEVANLEAISTVKGLQVQLGLSKVELLTVRSEDEFLEQDLGLAIMECVLLPAYDDEDKPEWCDGEDGIDDATACQLLDHYMPESGWGPESWRPGEVPPFPPTPPDPHPGPTYRELAVGLCPNVDEAVEPVSEIRIARQSLFRFAEWIGNVAYMRRPGTVEFPTVAETGYLIQPASDYGASGGFTSGFLSSPLDCFVCTWDPFVNLDATRSFFDPLAGFDMWSSATLGSVLDFDISSTLQSSFGFDPLSYNYLSPAAQINWVGDPVAVATGNFFTIENDLGIPGPGGHGLKLVRSYNSQLAYDGPLGHGWTHTYDQHLQYRPGDLPEGEEGDPPPDRIVWLDERGLENAFTKTEGGGWQAPAWLRATLEKQPDESYLIRTKEGTEFHFGSLVEAAGGRARLDAIRDRNDNEVRCGYDASGKLIWAGFPDGNPVPTRRIRFEYSNDAVPRLASVKDWTEREWKYSVDAEGDLRAYTDPVQVAKGALGRSWTYDYYTDQRVEKLNHNLLRWRKPVDGDDADTSGDVSMEFRYFDNDTVFQHESSTGETTTFSYNFLRKRTTVFHPDGARETYVYDRFGNLEFHEDGRGVGRGYLYDGDQRNLLEETDGLGFVTTADYDDKGNRTKLTDRTNETETWRYNAFGEPVLHRDAEGRTRTWRYDASGNLLMELSIIDGREEPLREYRYEPIHRNLTEVREYGDVQSGEPRITRFEYDAAGISLIRVVDPAGATVRFDNDALGRPTAVRTERTSPETGTIEEVTARVSYDALDRVTQAVDPEGAARQTEYNANGNVLLQRSLSLPPTGAEAILASRLDVMNEYDAEDRLVRSHGFPDSHRDAAYALAHRLTTQFAYDLRGRLVRTTTPLGHTLTQEYDGAGNLIAATDAAGVRTARLLDPEGRVIDEIDPLGLETRTEYDPEGRPTRSWLEFDRDPSLKAYSAANPLAAKQRPLSRIEYDAAGLPTSLFDAAESEIEVDYDGLGRRTEVRSYVGTPEQGTTQFEYDLSGRMTSRTELVSSTTGSRTVHVGYDAAGRVSSVVDPLGRLSQLGYDELGRLIEQTNAEGVIVRFTHDRAGRLLSRTGPGVDDEFRYDGFGRQVYARNSEGTQQFEYDGLDRVIAVRDSQFGTSRRTYDEDGRLAAAVYPDDATEGYPGGVVVRYERDARGLLTALIDPDAGMWRFAYDAAGRPVGQRDPNGLERITSYTEDGRLSAVELRRNATVLERFDYDDDYDVLGNPRKMTSNEGETHVTYDERSQIKEVRYRAGTANQLLESFEYDLVGNRVKHVFDEEERRYTIDLADQLQDIRAPAGTILESFENDAAGRRIRHQIGSQPATTYSYDGLSRLTSIAEGAAAPVTLAYDAFGGRRERKIGATTDAVFYGEWIERRGSDKRRLVHGDGIDHVLAEVGSAATHPLVHDGLANVVRVDDGTTPAVFRPTNGSFEGAVPGGVPAGWTRTAISAQHGTWALDASVAYGTGGASMRLDVDDTIRQPNGDLNLTLNLELRSGYQPPPNGHTRYRVSACFKTENQQNWPAQVTLVLRRPDGTTSGQTVFGNLGTTDWDCKSSAILDLTNEPAGSELTVYSRLNEFGPEGGTSAYGTTWVDNVRIIPLDAAGNPILSADEDVGLPGASDSRRYEAFGRPRTTPAFYPTERGFAGRPIEGTTGLVNIRARHYDPATGRFLQADPLGIDSEQLYAYARSNPYVNWDPTGLRGMSLNGGSSGTDLSWGSTLSTRAMGGVQFAGGLFMAGTAAVVAPTSVTGFGAIATAGLATLAVDQMSAGLHQMISGVSQDTLVMQTGMSLGLSRPQATALDMGLGLVAGGAAGAPRSIGLALGTVAARGASSPLVFRQGTFADEAVGWSGNVVKGRQWAAENPLTTPNYTKRYGLPAENATPDWVVGGRIRGPYEVRPAPASHNNPLNTGGAPEYVPRNPNDVILEFFHMPD